MSRRNIRITDRLADPQGIRDKCADVARRVSDMFLEQGLQDHAAGALAAAREVERAFLLDSKETDDE